MKTFKEFQEGFKTAVGLGLGAYTLYRHLTNKGKTNQEQPNNKKTKVNKNNDNATNAQRGFNFLKKRKEDLEKGKTPVIFGDPEGNFRNFFDN